MFCPSLKILLHLSSKVTNNKNVNNGNQINDKLPTVWLQHQSDMWTNREKESVLSGVELESVRGIQTSNLESCKFDR